MLYVVIISIVLKMSDGGCRTVTSEIPATTHREASDIAIQVYGFGGDMISCGEGYITRRIDSVVVRRK